MAYTEALRQRELGVSKQRRQPGVVEGGRAATGRALWACVCVVCLVFTPSPGGWGRGRQTRGSQPLQLSSEREACHSARGEQPKVRPSLWVLAEGRGQDRNSRHRPKRAEAHRCAAEGGRRRRPEAGGRRLGWGQSFSPVAREPKAPWVGNVLCVVGRAPCPSARIKREACAHGDS